MIVTRDYGETANEKANELLFHLGLATLSIVLLVGLVIGWREGIVVLIVIPTTILMTLFASYIMGYTINRVSLFALIFSIGILVDDAIVVIENIARHWAMGDGRPRARAAIEAVAEVGNPTIVATLTVVAALLPMLFVSGLMGPYMAPIPTNASSAMVLSFFVAMMVTPWLMLKIAGRAKPHGGRWPPRRGRRLARPRLSWRWPGRSSPALDLLAVPVAGRHRHARLADAVRHPVGDGEAAAVRQQVGVAGRPRPAARLVAGGDRTGARRSGAAARRHPRTVVDPVLCRHRLAVQFQRPRPPLLSAVRTRAGRPADQSGAGEGTRRGSATPSPSKSASG